MHVSTKLVTVPVSSVSALKKLRQSGFWARSKSIQSVCELSVCTPLRSFPLSSFLPTESLHWQFRHQGAQELQRGPSIEHSNTTSLLGRNLRNGVAGPRRGPRAPAELVEQMIISTGSGYISPRLREWMPVECRYKIPLGGPRSCSANATGRVTFVLCICVIVEPEIETTKIVWTSYRLSSQRVEGWESSSSGDTGTQIGLEWQRRMRR